MFKLIGKKIITLLRYFLLNWPYNVKKKLLVHLQVIGIVYLLKVKCSSPRNRTNIFVMRSSILGKVHWPRCIVLILHAFTKFGLFCLVCLNCPNKLSFDLYDVILP